MNLVLKLLGDDIRKPSALVHFEREMSPVEQKIMTLIIFHSQVMDSDDKGFYYIKKSFIREFLGWEESNNYPRIYQAFKSIFDNSVTWNFLGTDRTFQSLMCKLVVSLLKPTATGEYIGYKLHPDLEPVIKDPKVFAKIKLIMMSILAKPKYAFPLYEILSDFYSRGEKSVKMPIELLRSSLGIASDAYESFIPFKRRVLKPNIDAINNNTDCKVTYSTYRENRKVAGLIFEIEKQNWQPPLLMNHFNELQVYYENSRALKIVSQWGGLNSAEEKAFFDSVSQLHITEQDVRRAIDTHSLTGAIEIRDYVLLEVERRSQSKDPVRDIGAYMARCLKEGFGKKTQEERNHQARVKAEADKKRSQAKVKEDFELQAKNVKDEFWSYQMELVDNKLAQMEQGKLEELNDSYTIQNPLFAKGFRESGLERPTVRASFYKFAVQQLLSAEERDIHNFAKSKEIANQVIKLLD